MEGELTVEIRDATGKVVATFRRGKRVTWTLTEHAPPDLVKRLAQPRLQLKRRGVKRDGRGDAPFTFLDETAQGTEEWLEAVRGYLPRLGLTWHE